VTIERRREKKKSLPIEHESVDERKLRILIQCKVPSRNVSPSGQLHSTEMVTKGIGSRCLVRRWIRRVEIISSCQAKTTDRKLKPLECDLERRA